MANGGSNVDLATQATNLSDARLMYNANAAVISITNDMYGSLLDIFDNQDSDQDGNS
jgi:flagellar hook protein FlgE